MPAFVPVVAESRAASGAAAIEIGDAVLRAGPGVELRFLGAIIGLLETRA
jgi:hypothetical protein